MKLRWHVRACLMFVPQVSVSQSVKIVGSRLRVRNLPSTAYACNTSMPTSKGISGNAVRQCSMSDVYFLCRMAFYRHASGQCRTEVWLWVKVTLSLFHRGGGGGCHCIILFSPAIGFPVLDKKSACRIAIQHQTVSCSDVNMCLMP